MSTRVRSHPLPDEKTSEEPLEGFQRSCVQRRLHLAGIFKVNTVTKQTWEHFNTVTELIMLKK